MAGRVERHEQHGTVSGIRRGRDGKRSVMFFFSGCM